MNTRTMGFFALAILLGLLAGCKQVGNSRPISGEKGVYSGEVDATLSDETRQKLRQRMLIQRGGSI